MTAQIKQAEAYRPEMGSKHKGDAITTENMNKINAIARRTAVKLFALCCPGTIPGNTLLKQVPALETQYRNAERSLKYFPMGGDKDLGSDSSDNDSESDDSASQISKQDSDVADEEEEGGAFVDAAGAAPAAAELFDPFDDYWKTKVGPKDAADPVEHVVKAAEQTKLAQGVAKGDPEALASLLSPNQALRAVLERDVVDVTLNITIDVCSRSRASRQGVSLAPPLKFSHWGSAGVWLRRPISEFGSPTYGHAEQGSVQP